MDNYALKAVTDLPAPFRSAFSFRFFNSLQSDCFSTCFLSDINMVISAPTGSGKTVLFELCIMRLLSKFIRSDGSFIHHRGTLKTIYVAPSKALVQEKLRDWSQKLGHLGINCLELTGDNEHYSIQIIQDADIILTTPEKFDAVTRYRIKDGGLCFFSDISLVLIDEVHLLNDPRGAALEAIVSRIKMLARNPEMKSSSLSRVRFLAVSATIPNVYDLAEWLMVPTEGIKRYGEEMRPVKLTTKVFGYTPAKNDFLFEKRLQNYIFDLLSQYSGGKSALVFCSTRKGAQEAAQHLSHIAMTFGHSSPFVKSREQQERLREASLSCSDKQMQSYMIYGVGYHNGGLSMKDRSLIEGLFLNGDLRILCTTNTLAHGINLPAHTVVIKSTQYFNKEKGSYMEYERSMVLQMCGRAGRPPFDDSGMVIIMTRKETVHLYENLLSGCEMVESQLLPSMVEHLTAEIVQAAVSDITMAIEWMKCSYLYVRMKKNPENYPILKGLPGNLIEKHLQDICVQKVNELSKYQLVWTDEDGFLLRPLEPGRLMTKYYLKFDTMKQIIQAPVNCSTEEALHILCRAEEISWIQLRRNEKKFLNDINIDKDGRLRFHVLDEKGKRKKRIQSREEKIFVLVNDCLTGDPVVHDLSMSQDVNSICSNGSRVAKCMKEYFLYKKCYRGALNSTLVAKCLQQKLWDDSPFLLKQLPGIGMVTAKALHSMGVMSFETLSEADPRKIELITGRKYPFGDHIKSSLQSLPPKVEILVEETENQRLGNSTLRITLTRLSSPEQSTKRHYADMMVGIEEDNLILFHEKIRLEEFSSPYSTTVTFTVPQLGKLTIKADLISEDFIGVDLHQKVIVTPKTDIDHKYRPREQSSCQPRNGEIRIDASTCHAPSKDTCDYNELIKNSISMPSFQLLDEDYWEDGETVIEMEDDDCRIISEKTVFDLIREKAKQLPVLPLPKNTCTPSLETVELIRKRSREKHLELENDLEKNKVPRSTLVNQYPEVTLLPELPNVFVAGSSSDRLNDSYLMDIDFWSKEDKFTAETQKVESFTLAGESRFEHIKENSRKYSQFNNSNTANSGECQFTAETKSTKSFAPNYSEFSNLNTDVLIHGGLSSKNDVSRNTLILDAEIRDTKGTGLNKSVEMLQSISMSDTFKNVRVPAKDSSNGLGLRTNQMPTMGISPSLLKTQNCSVAVERVERKVHSYLGFQSVFSFL